MRSLFALILLMSTTATAAPTVEDCTVLRPRFVTQDGSFAAGSALAVEVNGKLLVATAMHLFGPAGGLKEQIEGAKIPEFTKSISLRDAFSNRDCGKAHKGLTLSDTHPMKDDAVGDIAAFEAKILTGLDKLESKAKPLKPVKLAEVDPKKGDMVFVAAQFSDDKETRTREAKVVEISDKWLFFEYVDTELELAGTNGAPVLNDKGELVGINLGGGILKEKLVGSANPLPAVKKRLTEAVPKEP